MKIIGLTGGIATGKSTVSQMLIRRGYEVIDADAVVHELQKPHNPLLQQIADAFGFSVLFEDGSLNREKLGKIIFGNAAARAKLDSIMHPAVREEFKKRIAQSQADVLFLDVPLLFEARFDDLTDVNLVISASPKNQMKRLINRDQITDSMARERINSQMAQSYKIDLADFVINNDGQVHELEEKVEQFLGEIQKLRLIEDV